MNKIYVKSLFIFILLLFKLLPAIAQTITVGSVDPGPYGSGSTIAVPFTINDASGCINTNNVYSLYLCDALGNPIPGAPVDTIQNFYGTAFNFTVPAGTPAGTYTFVIKSSSPPVSSSPSNLFTISATAGSTAAATCPSTEIGNTTYPNTYGTCSGTNGMTYTFTNASSSGSTTTATFYNETTQAVEASNVILNPNYTFTASAATYLVTVKSVNAAGIISTYSYQLINNVVNTNFGTIGGAQACLVNGQAVLTYTIDYSSITGIQHNFPGNLYTISWGDGSPNSVYTLCQIEALNGLITHTYTKTSCGYTAGTNTDAFPVNYYTTNQYCGRIGTIVSDDAQIYNVPVNSFTGPTIACTNSVESFINTSIPQPCNNTTTARYNWSVDGVIVGASYPLIKNFVTTLTEGSHVISLHLVNPISGAGCFPADFTQTICVQNPPQPSFTFAQKSICIGSGPITPVNTSVVDTTCNNSLTYAWSVTPSTGVSFNPSSAQPGFTFTSTGIYQISLSITTPSCGKVTAPMVDTIVVNTSPVAVLSPDFSICGTNQTLKFDSLTTSKTYTTLTGTLQPQANTYAWTVTGGAYSYAPGYSASSKYPHILFTDYATYTITVTQQNNCGLVTSAPQHITFEQAPTVVAGNDTSICAGTNAKLNGSITGTGVISYKWVGGTGTYSPSANTLNPTYTPSAAEVSAGHVTLTLQVTTSDAAPCNLITSSVIITITPIGSITSSLTKSLCSNQRLNYQITSNNAGSTFAWTAQLISGSATGFSASGTTSLITDSLINTDPTATTNAVIAYTITPISSSGCPGIPATLNVTITPLPILTATVTNAIICSGQLSNISLTSELTGTKYTWTSSAPAGVSGNTNKTTAVSTTNINDILVNTGTSPAKVTYTIIPYSTSGCEGSSVIAVVTVDPAPITAIAGPNTTVCGANTYVLNGNSPGFGSGKWTVATGMGVTFSNDTTANPTVSGLIPGNTYQFTWTITTGTGCQSQSTVTITDNLQTVPGTTAATGPTTVCANGNSGQINLTGQVGKILMWQKSVDGGATWQTVTPVDTLASLLYNNLTTTTQYEAVVQNDACSILTSTVTTITVNQPAPIANAGTDVTLCAAASYALQGNSPGTNAGVWREVSGPPVTFADSTNYQTTANNLQGGNTYIFSWTIKGASPCANSQAQVTITDNPQTTPGVTAATGPTTVCANGNNGQINLTGQLGKIIMWQQSVDGGATWQAVAPIDTLTSLLYTNLTQTTSYEAIVQNNPCNTAASTITTITVNQPAPIANAGTDVTLCAATSYALQGNSPGTNAGAWREVSGPPVTFADSTNYQTTANNLQGGNTYIFSWTIKGASPCANSQAQVTITDNPQTTPGVTATTGPTTVCANGNNGQINLTGQLGKIIMWQQSVDGGTTWQAVAPIDTLTSLLYTNLTQTTEYEAIVQNNPCNMAASTITTITVNQPAPMANAGTDTTLCAATSYGLHGNSPGINAGAWREISGPPVTFADSTNYQTTVNNLQGGNIYVLSWVIKGASPCANTQAQVTITNNPQTAPGVTAATGPTTVCANGNSGQINLTGQIGKILMWQQSIDGGTTWQTVAPLDTLSTLLYKNLTQTTQYEAIVQNNPCNMLASTITTITVNQPAPMANAGTDTTLCAATSYGLHGNSPGINAGAWREISGPAVTFADSTNYQTTVNNLQGGNIYVFSWTIKGASPCANSQAQVTITNNPQTAPGVTTATGPTTVCANGNSGQINLTGQLGRILMWQQSVNGGATWQTVSPLDTLSTLLYNNLTQTTEYEAIVQNNPCNMAASTITTITVNQPAPVASAGRDTSLCGATTYTLIGNNPGNNAGVWRQTSGTPVTIADTSNYQTTISNLQGGNTYTFSWTILGAAPCANSQAQVTIIDKADVIASFKNSATNSCGSQTVTFTNTSTNQSGALFLWNFGDGTTSTTVNPQHIFTEPTNGTDTTYIVSLTVLSNCQQRPPVYDTIHITSDKVIVAILPQQTTGCTPYILDVENVSPGTNVSYKFYLYDGNTLVQEIDKTDKTDAVFNPLVVTTPTQYTVYMTAVGPCGTSATTNSIPIFVSPPTVKPQMYILNGINSGCAPLSVFFVNNSSGGSSYHYNIYDANGNIIEQPIAGTANLPYTFTSSGSYSVSITAANNCSPQGVESARIPINVYPVPQPAFTSSSDCDATVTFSNTTVPDGTTPPVALSYTWNFGDGSAPEYSFTPKPHAYDFKKSPFNAVLTATNTATGCADSIIQTINVTAPLVAQFTEKPDSVTTIPNYEFSFIDESAGPPTSWMWDFGDGTTSTAKNPEHRYADTGYYQVRLVIGNNGSCVSSATHVVRITGTPGELFLPNAFMPTGRMLDLQVFMAKGSGIKTWLLQIFNNYGQLLWQTTKLDSKGSPVDGWDGMYKGILMPQGAYLWQASATFINGSQWQGMSYNGSLTKRTGTVNLIR